MEHIKTFFDTSTIHGLNYISSTRKLSRLFWILVVIGGFSVAGYLIYESFDNWKQSPISTTIETLPISKIMFPNVTVCPPKNLFLNLNYDILKAENKTIDKDRRKKFIEDCLEVFQDKFYNEIMRNLSKVTNPDRYLHWYHGYTKIKYPYHWKSYNLPRHSVYTSAISGNISTQYFEEKFDAEKVEKSIYISIYVNVPPSVKGDNNVTLMFDINKRTMGDNDRILYWRDKIDDDLTHWSKQVTAPDTRADYYKIYLDRKVSADEIKDMKLDMMPGFRLTWKYNTKIEHEARYRNDDTTKEFVRLELLQFNNNLLIFDLMI